MSQNCGSSYENTLAIQIIIISARVVTDKITEECAESRGLLDEGQNFFLYKKAKKTGCKLFSF